MATSSQPPHAQHPQASSSVTAPINGKPDPTKQIPDSTYILAEYGALREEIMKHMDMRLTTLNYYLAATGVIYTAALSRAGQGQNGALIFLIQPILSVAFVNSWAESNSSMFRTGAYIRKAIETQSDGGLKWETTLWNENSCSPIRNFLGFDILPALMFLGGGILSGLLAWTIQISASGPDELRVFSAAAGAGLLISCAIFYLNWRKVQETLK